MRDASNSNAGLDCSGPVGRIIGQHGDACAGGRQSAKGVIRDRARQLHAEADRLEALARALPEELPPQADQALWDLAIAARRAWS